MRVPGRWRSTGWRRLGANLNAYGSGGESRGRRLDGRITIKVGDRLGAYLKRYVAVAGEGAPRSLQAAGALRRVATGAMSRTDALELAIRDQDLHEATLQALRQARALAAAEIARGEAQDFVPGQVEETFDRAIAGPSPTS